MAVALKTAAKQKKKKRSYRDSSSCRWALCYNAGNIFGCEDWSSEKFSFIRTSDVMKTKQQGTQRVENSSRRSDMEIMIELRTLVPDSGGNPDTFKAKTSPNKDPMHRVTNDYNTVAEKLAIRWENWESRIELSCWNNFYLDQLRYPFNSDNAGSTECAKWHNSSAGMVGQRKLKKKYTNVPLVQSQVNIQNAKLPQQRKN